MNIYLRLNANLYGYKAGTIIKTKACAAGIPLDRRWRKRLIESEKDNCIKVLKRSNDGAISG